MCRSAAFRTVGRITGPTTSPAHPDSTTRSGFSRLTRLAIPIPRYSPTRVNVSSAAGSLSARAANSFSRGSVPVPLNGRLPTVDP